MQAEQQSGLFPKRIMDLLRDIATPDGGPNRGPWEDGNGRRLDADARKAVEWITARAALSHPSTPQGWKDMAYAKLGFVRDKMTPEHVDAVQRFLRDEYAAPPEQGGRNA